MVVTQVLGKLACDAGIKCPTFTFVQIAMALTLLSLSQTLTGKEIEIDIEPTDKVSKPLVTLVCQGNSYHFPSFTRLLISWLG